MLRRLMVAVAIAGVAVWVSPVKAQKISFDEVMKNLTKCRVDSLQQLLTGVGPGQVADANSFTIDASLITSDEGVPAVVAAAATDCEEGERTLLNAGASVDQVDKQGNTPLHMAAASSTESMVQLLVEKHADVNAKNAKDETPLMLAQSNNYKGKTEQRDKIIAYLKKKGAK